MSQDKKPRVTVKFKHFRGAWYYQDSSQKDFLSVEAKDNDEITFIDMSTYESLQKECADLREMLERECWCTDDDGACDYHVYAEKHPRPQKDD